MSSFAFFRLKGNKKIFRYVDLHRLSIRKFEKEMKEWFNELAEGVLYNGIIADVPILSTQSC
jgi:hypothetical protein